MEYRPILEHLRYYNKRGTFCISASYLRCLIVPDCFYLQNAGLVSNTILKSQIRNRKRAHMQSPERTGSGGPAGGGASRGRGAEPSEEPAVYRIKCQTLDPIKRDFVFAADEAPSSSSGAASSPVAMTTEEDSGLLYLYPFKARQTQSSSAHRDFVPKGVLKHTQCTGTESSVSMETVAKKVRLWPHCVLLCPLWLKEAMSCGRRVYCRQDHHYRYVTYLNVIYL